MPSLKDLDRPSVITSPGGSYDDRAVYQAIAAVRQAVNDAVKLINDRTADVEAPKLVLLDPIPDVTIAGPTDVNFRVYIDD